MLSLNGAAVKIAALLVFLLACATDYWDGWVARRMNQSTAFGKLMDPIADKFLTLAAFVAFTQKNLVPAWMVVVVVARDFLITGIRLAIPYKGELHGARPSGKNKTVLQFLFIVGTLGFLIAREFAFWQAEWESGALAVIYWCMALVLAATLWSGASYLIKNRKLFE